MLCDRVRERLLHILLLNLSCAARGYSMFLGFARTLCPGAFTGSTRLSITVQLHWVWLQFITSSTRISISIQLPCVKLWYSREFLTYL